MTECAGLEIRYTLYGYRGFESLTLRTSDDSILVGSYMTYVPTILFPTTPLTPHPSAPPRCSRAQKTACNATPPIPHLLTPSSHPHPSLSPIHYLFPKQTKPSECYGRQEPPSPAERLGQHRSLRTRVSVCLDGTPCLAQAVPAAP